ncbi:uncharacterized protein LOC115244170 [Formica exsecta]|uniref:uncharacterized protein LOC115244170 n=1 Tax=Formica exsecta TaxID=72781 RepID=UPI0011439908|nr:uncharacterized protein LOC115244170 [Formica exsecta]
MLRIRKIVGHPKLQRFWTRWRILMWKAVLMRLHNPITTALEIIIAIIFSLQMRLIFEPHALYSQDLDRYNRDDILAKLPNDVNCWYAPKNAFIDELMSKAAKMLRTNVQAADSEINLVNLRYTKNDTSKVLWAIFEIEKLASGKPKVLKYKIRSSEIGENRIIMMHEKEPAHKATKALLTSILFWIFLTHFTIVLDQFLIGATVLWKIGSLMLPHSGLLYGLVAFTTRANFAMDDVTIDFYHQEFSVILGHNGAGKSCLLKTIIGMYKPTHGHVYVEGRDNVDESTMDPIGYCPQENILMNDLTTIQHIYIFGMDIKRERTILMATNSMEAADLLADRIAIIANGRIECYGSKMYLNRRYGIGYVLSLLVQENCDVERVRAEIQEFSANPITVRDMMGLVIRFDVPRSSRFTKLLQHLESNKEELGIVSAALSAASIEGQFLRYQVFTRKRCIKIGLESQFKERCVQLPSNKYELIVQQRRRHLLQTGMIGYCPQINGLSDFMTGRQYLQLHAALRGVPYECINDEVNTWLDGILKYELESGISYSYVFDKLEKLRQRYMWITDFSVTQPSMDEVLLTLAKKQKKLRIKLTLYERLYSWIARNIRKI